MLLCSLDAFSVLLEKMPGGRGNAGIRKRQSGLAADRTAVGEGKAESGRTYRSGKAAPESRRADEKI